MSNDKDGAVDELAAELTPAPAPEAPKAAPAPEAKKEEKPEKKPEPQTEAEAKALQPAEPRPVRGEVVQSAEDKALQAARPVPVSAESVRINESRKALEHPLSAGTKFFESPEGYIVVGDADKPHVWCRQANHGKGCFINPRR